MERVNLLAANRFVLADLQIVEFFRSDAMIVVY